MEHVLFPINIKAKTQTYHNVTSSNPEEAL